MDRQIDSVASAENRKEYFAWFFLITISTADIKKKVSLKSRLNDDNGSKIKHPTINVAAVVHPFYSFRLE